MSAVDSAVAALAASQHGVFALPDLAELEMTRAARRHRIAIGRWETLYDGVYRLAGVPESWRGSLLAACLAAGPGAVASHRAAAALWDLPAGTDAPVEVTCPRWLRRHTGVIVHETKALDEIDTTQLDAIPVTTVARTLLDLGAVCRPAVVEVALDNALRRELLDLACLRELIERVGRRGRNGTGVLRDVLRERSPLAGRVESPMETLLLRMLRSHGLPTPIPQYVVRVDGRFIARVDAAYPAERIAIEYDSYQEHTGKIALVRDSARRNQLITVRWTTITATAADLRSGGHAIANTVRAALRSAS